MFHLLFYLKNALVYCKLSYPATRKVFIGSLIGSTLTAHTIKNFPTACTMQNIKVFKVIILYWE